MADEHFFNADDLDLDAALLAGFGLQKGLDADEADETDHSPDGAQLPQVTHGQLTHRVGQVGRLQVTFAFHHGDHQHD